MLKFNQPDYMRRKGFRCVAICIAAALLAGAFVLSAWAYPKTAPCPIDGGTGHATGKKREATQTSCIEIEYKHKGTDYSDPRHPQKYNHLYWVTQCSE